MNKKPSVEDIQYKLEFVGEMPTISSSPQKDAFVDSEKAETSEVLLQSKIMDFYEHDHDFFTTYSSEAEKKKLDKCHLSNFSLANHFFAKYLFVMAHEISSSGRTDLSLEELRLKSDALLTKNFFNLKQTFGKIISHRQKFFFQKFSSYFLKQSRKQKIS